ncbi:hypothetical protein [Algoriphagus marinus]|uniref:hypothetical protein n=1 Tax=Algoriphagus marinus TaxID=1925762 RepID=UPI0011152DF3|nr:hypothetical protein [Algoriphagus marinus]
MDERDSLISSPKDSWMVGINTHLFQSFVTEDLFGGDSLKAARIEFMGRKQVKNNQALRFRLFGGFDTFFKESKSNFPNAPGREETFRSIGTVIGYEWQFRIASRWYGYYGMDLEWNLARRKKIQYGAGFMTEENIPTQRYERHIDLENSFSGLPFFGIGFKVTERLLVTAESKIVLSYSHKKRTFEESIMENPDPLTVEVPITPPVKYQDDILNKDWLFSFLPYNGVVINYRF